MDDAVVRSSSATSATCRAWIVVYVTSIPLTCPHGTYLSTQLPNLVDNKPDRYRYYSLLPTPYSEEALSTASPDATSAPSCRLFPGSCKSQTRQSGLSRADPLADATLHGYFFLKRTSSEILSISPLPHPTTSRDDMAYLLYCIDDAIHLVCFIVDRESFLFELPAFGECTCLSRRWGRRLDGGREEGLKEAARHFSNE